MERAQYLVLVVVAAAVALFALRIFLGGAPTQEEETALSKPIDERSVSATRGYGGHRRPEPEANDAGSASGRALQEHRERDDFGGHRTDASGSPSKRSADSAPVVTSGDPGRRVVVGASGGRGSGPAGALSVGGGVESGRRPVPNEDRRSEIVQFLASQPKSEQTLAETLTGEGDESQADVVLSVPLVGSTEAEGQIQPIEEKGVEVSDDGVGVTFTEGAVVKFPNAGNARGDAGSITFELEPQWAGSDDTNNSFVQIRSPHDWSNRLQLTKNGRFLRFILTDNTGQETDISVPIDSWTPGERRQITATWGDALTALYVDGRLMGQNTYPGQLEIKPGTPLYLGSDLPGGASAAAATLQDFKIYGRALRPDEIVAR